VTPARDQMSCGSCAAFAATGAHETCMLKAGARMNGLDLSEQMLVDCGFNGQVCAPSSYIFAQALCSVAPGLYKPPFWTKKDWSKFFHYTYVVSDKIL
jgi:hypothetical protein